MTDRIEEIRADYENISSELTVLPSEYQIGWDDLGFILDTLALREAGMLREWEPIATCPYDEICLMLLEDGNIIQDFMYDCGPDWLAERGVTHWMPLPPPPQKDD